MLVLFWVISGFSALELLFHAICGNGVAGFIIFVIIMVGGAMLVKFKFKKTEPKEFVSAMIFVLLFEITISFLMAFTGDSGSSCPSCGERGMMKMPNGGWEGCPNC